MNKKCLVIDDVEVSRYVISAHMTELGFEVFEAVDEESALDLFSKDKFDVTILDLHLRHKSGLDIIPGMNKISGTEDMVVIVCSGVEKEEMASERVKQSGAHAFLSKPISRDQLVAELEKLNLL